ncbi:MAG: long-chain fatty acid--CoA ligase [Deltaproteobacteria bacterium]|nr:long-chain fatty acid--CoA ligase [Deltaproteobacteria bacterium]
MADLDVNIGHWVRKNAQIYPDKTAVKSLGRAFTYRELSDRMNRLANGLRGLGLARGDRVALLLLNGTEYVEAVFACSAIGLIAVPLNWRLGQDEQAFVVADCAPRVLIHHAAFEERALALQRECASIEHRLAVTDAGGSSPYEELLAAAPAADAVDPAVGGDDPHLIMYTAGTTGHPKGVVLTHANCFWQSVNGWALGVSPKTVALVVLPLFHVGGLNGSVTPMIHVGASVLLPPKFDVAETLETIERERVSGLLAVPAVYQMMYDHPRFASTDFSSIEALISGGAPLPLDLIRKYHQRGLEFRQGYGLTETAPGATGMGPGECLDHAGTAGRACLYVDLAIVDDGGHPLPPGQAGEVCVRGPNVMRGYWNRPDETASALRGGWFHSGDIGFVDDAGYLTLVDRKKDMIISGGENVYPAEIEKVLQEHAGVAEVAVVGRPDAKWGEVPVAFVVPRRGCQLTADELLAFCRDRIGRYKQPKEFFFRQALPRNAAGKVLKPELRREAGNG